MRPPNSALLWPRGGFALLGIGEVAGDHDRLAAAGFDLAATGSIAAVSRPISASLQPSRGEGVGDGGAHALGRAGDEGDAIFKREFHGFDPCWSED